ncbi:hypothetical protein SeMB42_g06613 [Synchytrium endobioticum]|uniref:Cytochrome b561 domain-containing protein n=1 Tax=Synchytrium endobioticum TaxID=286115 RepID=A0A507CGN7_9FUNG|nr:hypothetical protein SeMB42_g06613 [Synchytrium endobioticum]TPX45525.1 hypothetical protein SeLEV6574_g03802 [Synchytrium endobioticum]
MIGRTSNAAVDDEASPLITRLNDSALGSLTRAPLHRRIVASITDMIILFVVACTWFFVFSHRIGLFSVHPSAMSLYAGLATSAIVALQQATSNVSRRDAFVLHWKAQVVALTSIIAGFIVIVMNKIHRGGAHFTSLHGQLGLATLILVMIQGFFGLSRRFWIWPAIGLNYQQIIALHRVVGWAIDNWHPSELRTAVKVSVVVVCVILLVHAQWGRILRLLLHKEPLIA